MRSKEEKKCQMRFKRKMRVRKRVRGTQVQPRLSVFRSDAHIYAQLIDDEKGLTLASCSSLDKELRAQLQGKNNIEIAHIVGETLARRALASSVDKVNFDRGPYKYHGRVKELAQGARQAGLKF